MLCVRVVSGAQRITVLLEDVKAFICLTFFRSLARPLPHLASFSTAGLTVSSHTGPSSASSTIPPSWLLNALRDLHINLLIKISLKVSSHYIYLM